MSEGISIEEACQNRVLTPEDLDRLCSVDTTLPYVWLIGGLLVGILAVAVLFRRKRRKNNSRFR